MRTYNDLAQSTWLQNATLQQLRTAANVLGTNTPTNRNARQTRTAIISHLRANPQTVLPTGNVPWPQPRTTRRTTQQTTRRTAPRRATPVAPATTTVVHNNPLPWIIGAIALVLLCLLAFGMFYAIGSKFAAAMIPPPVGSPTNPVVPNNPPAVVTQPVTWSYPLTGQTYSSPQGFEYDAVWTPDGRLWQPQLPTGALRIAHTVAFTIEEGSYAFDGVECQLFVDPTRNGAGASNPVTAAFGNDLRFTVKTADGGQAWALVQCRGNASSGFQIRWLGK